MIFIETMNLKILTSKIINIKNVYFLPNKLHKLEHSSKNKISFGSLHPDKTFIYFEKGKQLFIRYF
jgi:hypothetical protein